MKRYLVIALVILAAIGAVFGYAGYTRWRDNLARQAFEQAEKAEQAKLLRDAKAAMAKGDYDTAVKLLKQCTGKEAAALLTEAEKKALIVHLDAAERFTKEGKYEEAARHYAKAVMYDPNDASLKKLSDDGQIRKMVMQAAARAEAARQDAAQSGSSGGKYSRADVVSYSIGSVSKSGNTARVSGTATMKDGNTVSGTATLAKVNGKWVVTGYSY